MINTFLKGIIIGLGKIMPGVSGSLFACLFNLYEPIISTLASPIKIIKDRRVIIPLMLGIASSIILFSGALKFFLDNYYVETIILFISMIVTSSIPLIKKCTNVTLKRKELLAALVIVFLIFLTFMVNIKPTIYAFDTPLKSTITILLSGILDALSSIVPGISGTALLMMIGTYYTIIDGLSTLNATVILPFIIGLIGGLITFAKLIENIYTKHRQVFDLIVLSFTVFSIVSLFLDILVFIDKKEILKLAVIFLTSSSITVLINKKIK